MGILTYQDLLEQFRQDLQTDIETAKVLLRDFETVPPEAIADIYDKLHKKIEEITQRLSIPVSDIVTSLYILIHYDIRNILCNIVFLKDKRQKPSEKLLASAHAKLVEHEEVHPLEKLTQKGSLRDLYNKLFSSSLYLESRIHLKLEWPKEEKTAKVPCHLLQILLEELARNAGKIYTDRGIMQFLERCVTFRCIPAETNITFEVVDNAGGIPENILDMLSQGKAISTTKGSGRGILLIKEIAGKENILMDIIIRPNEGTTCRLVVPTQSSPVGETASTA